MPQNNFRSIWIDYLRSFITILVVAHHAAMAYPLFAYFDKQTYINSTHPIVDSQRCIGFDIFIQFNDTFFMSLMFFIGGIFLLKSLGKKGTISFIKDRFFRLFVPFLLLGTLLMLLAYWPSFYISHRSLNIFEYIIDFFTMQKWPVGPPWFIWLLFIFNIIFAFLAPVYEWIANKIDRHLKFLKYNSFILIIFLFAISWLLYVPLSYSIGMETWIGIGPFDFQLGRVLLYFGYFSLGIIIGKSNFNQELFSTDSSIIKKWPFWVSISIVLFLILLIITQYRNELIKLEGKTESFGFAMLYYFIYTATFVLLNISFIAVFKRFIIRDYRCWQSFSDNAYMIYLLHYTFITWIQFLFLNIQIPVFFKFFLTLILSLTLSWCLSIILRKIAIFRKYL